MEYPYNTDAIVNIAIIGGFTLLAICMVIIFLIIIFGLKRNANIHKLKKWFWDEPRPNGQHKNEDHGVSKH